MSSAPAIQRVHVDQDGPGAHTKKTHVQPARRLLQTPASAAQHMWVPTRMAAAILQVNSSSMPHLKRTGEVRFQEGHGYNLADVLARYRRLVLTEGVIDQQIEAACMREFQGGLLPHEVVIKLGVASDAVKVAWTNWVEWQRDPLVTQLLAKRAAEEKEAAASRCRECNRTPELAAADTARIIRDVTYDPKRTLLTIAEERELLALGARCICGGLKATVSIELMRFRLRALRKVGETPPPVEQPALTDEERIKALCTCSAAGDPQGDHADACVAKQYVRKAGDAVRET